MLMVAEVAGYAGEQGRAAFVREHVVCYELSPQFELEHHEKVQVGVAVALLARQPERAADPGDDASVRIWEGLQQLIEEVLPPGARVVVEPFECSFRLRPQTGWLPEVQLRAEFLHAHGTFEPLDGGERRLVALVERRLRERGVLPAVESDARQA